MLPRDSVALCVCGWRGRRQRRAGCASSWLLLESCDVALLGGSKLTSAWGEEVQTELCTRKYLCLNGGVARKELSFAVFLAELQTICSPRITGKSDMLKRSNHIFLYRSIPKENNNGNDYQLLSIYCEPSCCPFIFFDIWKSLQTLHF